MRNRRQVAERVLGYPVDGELSGGEMTLSQRVGLVLEFLLPISDDADLPGSSHSVWAKLLGVDLARVRKKAEKVDAETGNRQTLNAQRSTFNVQVGKGEVRACFE